MDQIPRTRIFIENYRKILSNSINNKSKLINILKHRFRNILQITSLVTEKISLNLKAVLLMMFR
jgi:hypothetical protein